MKKNNNGIIVLLVVIIIIMATIIALLLTGTISLNSNSSANIETNNETTNDNSNSKKEKNSYSYNNMKGLYTFTSEKYMDESNEVQQSFYLYLYENGTFVYRENFMISIRYLGNYTIVNNKIILNNLFSTNSGTGIHVNEKENLVTIEITDNKTIVDTSRKIEKLNLSNITLTKSSTDDEKEFLDKNDFLDLLNNDEFINTYY